MKKMLMMAAVAVFTMTACSESDNSSVSTNDPSNPSNPSGPSNPSNTVLLVKNITVTPVGGSATTTTYEYDTRYISKIIYSPSVYEKLTYNFYGEIQRIDRYVNGQLKEYTECEYDFEMLRWRRHILNGNQPEVVYKTSVNWTMSNKCTLSTRPEDNSEPSDSYSYQLSGNSIVFKEHLTGDTDFAYTYDATRSPFFSVYDLSDLILLYPYLSQQNLITEQKLLNGVYAGKYRYEYTFNASGYPTECRRYNDGNNALLETTTFTYW